LPEYSEYNNNKKKIIEFEKEFEVTMKKYNDIND
jgi:hypothetical protein